MRRGAWRPVSLESLHECTGLAHGRLALILLLDQFTRNLYRGTAQAFSGDGKARQLLRDGLADAHELVPELDGPFDFVFSDADKDWYTKYFQALLPKLSDRACFTGHNVTSSRYGWQKEFLDTLNATPGMKTEVVRSSRSRACSSSSRWPRCSRSKQPESRRSRGAA